MKTVLTLHGDIDCRRRRVGGVQIHELRRPHGRWSATHWKTATFGWLALVLLAFAVGGQVGTKKQADPTNAGPGESGRMDRILDAGSSCPRAGAS